MLRKKGVAVFFILFAVKCFSQQSVDTINENEVTAVLSYLASDKLKGRVNYTKEQLFAAEYLGKKFKEYDLSPFPGFQYYYQPFSITPAKKFIKDKIKWNGRILLSASYINITTELFTTKKTLRDYKIFYSGTHLSDSILLKHWNDSTNILIWEKRDFAKGDAPIIGNVIIPANSPQHDILIVIAPDEPKEIRVSCREDYVHDVLFNVVGVLPGKSKPDEAIIFSAHYDHIDHSPTGEHGIFNGANDDASGTTAVVELAKYFSMKNANERTLIFCLFAGEELGLLGSQAFVQNLSPVSIKANINIEMIGMTNRVGKSAFFLTGTSYSNLYDILRKNLRGSSVDIRTDNFDTKNLFQRSDNYSFFQKRIVAHSIMCSDDNDPCYYEPCDDADRIDFKNMTEIIRAIAKSCQTLINVEDSPALR